MTDHPMNGARGTAARATGVGNEATADMKGAFSSGAGGGKAGYGAQGTPRHAHSPGTAAGDSSLSGATAELHRQHPHKYTDHGPFRSHEGRLKY